jgi:hypothetical protein
VAKANVNHAYHDICTRYPFSWLISTGTLTTTASQAYSVISTSGITDLWKILSIREENTPAILTAINRKTYEEYVSDDNTTTDIPQCYCDEYDDRVYWYHTPDSSYSMYTTYWKAITDRSNDSDTFIIPIRLQEALVLGGWYRQLQYFNRYGEAGAIKAEYESIVQKAIDEDSDRPDLIEKQARHIIGGIGTTEPKLSSHYRRY